MIIGVIFKDGKEIDRGIWEGGKLWHKDYPEQEISIVENNRYAERKTYKHGDGISFQHLQDNGNGWEVVYDSNERIDRTVNYPLPGWLFNNSPIPDYEHKINKDDFIDSEFKGYLR